MTYQKRWLIRTDGERVSMKSVPLARHEDDDNGKNFIYIKLATVVEGDPKAPFSLATTPRYWEGQYIFPGLHNFTLDPYLKILTVKQGGIKYHF